LHSTLAENKLQLAKQSSVGILKYTLKMLCWNAQLSEQYCGTSQNILAKCSAAKAFKNIKYRVNCSAKMLSWQSNIAQYSGKSNIKSKICFLYFLACREFLNIVYNALLEC
jgi:hypothetical protein